MVSVKVVEYEGFGSEEEALEWAKKMKGKIAEFSRNFENTMIEFQAEIDELVESFFKTS